MKIEEFYDEHDIKMQEIQERKKRRKRKWKIIRRSTFCILVVVITLYLFSDYSKVKSLSVRNNHFYSEDEILSKAGLDYETRYLLIPGFFIEHKLENDPFIESVSVSKNLDGAIMLDVKEVDIIGYIAEDGGALKVLLSDGKLESVKSKYLSNVVLYPQIDGFDKDQLKKLAKSFRQAKQLFTMEVISMISEIHPYETNYDKHMVKLVMQDGNVVYTSLKGISLMDQYTKILGYLNERQVCLFIDEDTNSIQKNKCP